MDLLSFEQEQHQSHSLQLELGQQHLTNWNALSDRQAHHSEFSEPILSEFDNNLPEPGLQECSSQQKQIDTALGSTGEGFFESEEPSCEKENEQRFNRSLSSQEAHTIYERSDLSVSGALDSSNVDIEQRKKMQKQQRLILNEFGALSRSTYIPLMSSLGALASALRKHSSSSADNVNMYYLFLTVKLQQESQRKEELHKQRLKLKEILASKQKNGTGTQEKRVFEEMEQKATEKEVKLQRFIQELGESCSRLKTLLGKVLEFGSRKIDHVSRHIQKTVKLQQQLSELVGEEAKRTQVSWGSKNDIQNDRYLQNKYLQERQKLFLGQLRAASQKIVAVLHSHFLKEEPAVASGLHKEMKRYSQLSQQTYGTMLHIPFALQEFSIKMVHRELAQILIKMVPSEWQITLQASSYCEEVIGKVNDYLQNQIFLPTVQVDPKLIKIRADASWLPAFKENKEKSHQKKDTQKENISKKANENSSKTQQRISLGKARGMKVSVVLTADSYLHLECGEKIACLRMKKLKLKKKGKRSILLMDNTRSLSSIFGGAAQLGQLSFADESAAQAFVETVLSHK